MNYNEVFNLPPALKGRKTNAIFSITEERYEVIHKAISRFLRVVLFANNDLIRGLEIAADYNVLFKHIHVHLEVEGIELTANEAAFLCVHITEWRRRSLQFTEELAEQVQKNSGNLEAVNDFLKEKYTEALSKS